MLQFAFALLPSAIIFLCLLKVVFSQADEFSWNGDGAESDVRSSTENGERVFLIKPAPGTSSVCFPLIRNLVYFFVCACVFSVSYGPGVLWLLPDAATDTQDEAVLQREPQRAGEGADENEGRPQQCQR